MAEPKRGVLGLDWKSCAVLLAYILMLIFAIRHYQPWEDEGRTWTDVVDFSLGKLTFNILRYEGHPVLWYWLLWPLPRLHVPFLAINWIASAFASAGTYLLLRFSAFPFYLRALLPFTFALGYEYAVVGRCYALFPLLGFWVAHLYRQKTTRPMTMAVALALLANLTVHGTIVASCFALAYMRKLAIERRDAGLPLRPTRQQFAAAAVFAASLLFVVIVIFPPSDLGPRANVKFMKAFRRVFPAAQPLTPHPLHFQTIALDTQVVATAGTAPEHPKAEPGLPVRQRLSLTFIYPFANWPPLALLFEALVVVYLIRRRQSLLLLAPLLLAAFLVVVYAMLWHTYLVWLTMVLILWAAWNDTQSPRVLSLQNAVAATLGLLCVLQLAWTFHALRYETTHSTYPARAAAAYLATLPPGQRIDGYDHAFTIEPYFRNKILNINSRALTSVSDALDDHPDVILLRETSISADAMTQILADGFQQTRSFCGTQYFPHQPLEPTCLLVLQKH